MVSKNDKQEKKDQDLSVLIVEDNDVSREVLRLALRDKHQIYAAKGEKEAWTLYKSKKPDVVFVDIRLSDGDGLHLTRRIKEDNPETYVVVMTVNDFEEEKEKAAQNFADSFIAKPFTQAEVEACLERCWTFKVHGAWV